MTFWITGLKEQLSKAKENAEQYKIIAETVEKNLREQNEAMEQFKETTEAKLNEAIEGMCVKFTLQKLILSFELHRPDKCFQTPFTANSLFN